MDDAVIENIRSDIENDEPISTDSLSGLSKLNATLYNFALPNGLDSYELGYSILDINEQFMSLDAEEITASINRNREIAKFSSVQVQDVDAELRKKREEIRQVITEKLSSLDQDTYIELVTILAEKCAGNEEYSNGVVLLDVIDQYEIRLQSVLEKSTEEIENHIERIISLPKDASVSKDITILIEKVKKWDILAQPLQLKSQASGMPHRISENLGSKLRQLALHLHNERGLTKDALVLANAMKSVFAELGGLLAMFETDSGTLSDLLKGQKENDEILAELDALKKESENVKAYPYTSVSNYVDRVRKLNRRLKATNLDAGTKAKVREFLCYMARSVAIELHNTKKLTSFSLQITRALVEEFGDMPLLKAKLSADVTTLNQQLVLTGTNRTVPSYTSRSSSSSSGKGCLTAFAWLFVIVVVIAMLSGIGSCSSGKKSSSSSKSSSSYSQSYSGSSSSKSSSSSSSSKSSSSSSSSKSSSDTSYSSSSSSGYTVTLNQMYGSGGTSSVTVSHGSSMPYATAPSRSGYIFKGYYADTGGKGTQYYDANMKGVHTWDSYSGGSIYAYWVKKTESKFTSSASAGDEVYADIVSIFPEIGIYRQGSPIYSSFVCKCKTSSGSTVWVYMSCSTYQRNFDSSASTSIYNNYADQVDFSSAKRIHGTVVTAESIMSGLSSDTGKLVIEFSSVS